MSLRVQFVGHGSATDRDKPLGDLVREGLSSGDYREFVGFIAFVSRAAAAELSLALSKAKGLSARLYVGIDQKGTSREALNELLSSQAAVFIYHSISYPIYHPKVFLFRGPHKNVLIVGSSNLTIPGLFQNVEASICVAFDVGDVDGERVLAEVEDFFEFVTASGGNTKPLGKGLIDDLEILGVLPSERERESRHDEPTKSATEKKLASVFPATRIPRPTLHARTSKAPRRKDEAAIPPKALVPRRVTKFPARGFWIEATKLTGGSRNQLDLSMVSKHKRIPGSLSLFGISASAKTRITTVALRFQGEDFTNNRILFPQTARGNSNGTWRLQLNGESATGATLTTISQQQFRDSFLVFTPIGKNHYEITAIPRTRAFITSIQAASKAWDQNRGVGGRLFGLF